MHEGVRAIPFNSIVFIDDWTMVEALMRGEINAAAALYNMAGVAENGYAKGAPWYMADVDDWLNMARKLYGWNCRWWANGKPYS